MTRVVSWNVHGFVAGDQQFSPEPALRVLERLAPDIVALQEVEDRDWQGVPALDWLANRGGWQAWAGPTLMRGDAGYGNAVLSRSPALAVRRHDLTVSPGGEPRGLLDVEFAHGDGLLRVMSTHLGLRRGERRRQVEEILSIAGPAERGRIDLLAGDFNEWLPGSRLLSRVEAAFDTATRARSFPGRWPLLALDRLYLRPARMLEGFRVERLPGGESDHLPIVATLSGVSALAHSR